MPEILPIHEHAVLLALDEEGGDLAFSDLVARTGLDQSLVAAAAQGLADRGYVVVAERAVTEIEPTPEGRRAATEGVPERRLLRLLDGGGPIPMDEVHERCRAEGFDGAAAVQWIFRKKWAAKTKSEDGGDALSATPAGRAALDAPSDDEEAIGRAARDEIQYVEELPGDAEELLKTLRSRKDLVKLKPRTLRRAVPTEAGRRAIAAGVRAVEEVTALSTELLAGGRWRDVVFKKFDVTLPAAVRRPGKVHPLVRIMQETREAFLSLGFTEWRSDCVESGFWDFDALFQPQDHPAREMQDTFYVARPARLPLPEDAAMVDRVRRTHEDGGDVGSTGWGYRWSAEKAEQAILRTHTTATTIRALAADPSAPRKVFTIGKVFRRETISYKHLPEFFQIDGIIVDEGANLVTLKGTLTEYYRKLGFSKVKFKPSFFPYTEPSAEVYVWHEGRGQWVEMGGSGIFRPEVTEPLGCRVPVLAWGLGLERLALFRYGAANIKALYEGDLKFLKEVPLCR